MHKIAVLLVVLILTGCAMANSTLLPKPSGLGGCHSDAGAYSLSKTYVAVEIAKSDSPDLGEEFRLNSVRLVRHPDKGKTYCLDYLGSPTSNETFTVQKDASGLLMRVSANSKDQSAAIAKKVADTIFTVVSGNPNFDPNEQAAGRSSLDNAPATLTSPYRAEFDPFNSGQAAVVNDSMRKFGFCMMIENQGLAPGQRDADSYCEHPLGGVSLERALADGYDADYQASPIPEMRGILYRPRVPYVMYLFVKRDLKAKGGWLLKASEAVHLENKSPVLGVGIDRAFFTDRKTTLTFDQGALVDIDINKKSELAGFVEIPLYIAQGIAALPTNIIQVKINETNNNTALINAQQQLIDSQKSYQSTLSQLAKLQANPATTTQPDASNVPATSGRSTSLSPEEKNQCIARNASQWGQVEAQRYCNCAFDQCSAAGLSGQACENYCSGGSG
ncbi:hypothetical protein [Hyphomicrobium facile]|uniref:Uncharacterized protein n=1 Tax=Hyphomicrobium facile TaxID=51670 RepID=A0A1I7NVL9_9HYPH|nr:hypothetical protein [Hyphomicrobium facile]SFV38690.1 hypothetical protein SAMN04488557_3797 [Hyphomicrobium facile]